MSVLRRRKHGGGGEPKAARTFYTKLLERGGFVGSSTHNGPARLLLWLDVPGRVLSDKPGAKLKPYPKTRLMEKQLFGACR